MKISRAWLQKYFDAPLPEAQVLSDALTFHAFEIEGIEQWSSLTATDEILDVKVTANRGHDCLSHRGIAKELSAILGLPMHADPLRVPLPEFPMGIEMVIEDPARTPVGAAAYVRSVTVGPSPEWLKAALESVGQRSINNVVDATNYVMFDIGMPTHAFAADTFKTESGIRYGIRCSKKGEQLALLGGASTLLSGDEAVIVNTADEAVDIGGVKGGMRAELRDDTTELVLSASKFEPVQTRKAAQRFGQRTEAAKRFENEMADDLALYGIRAVAELVREVAGGEIVSYGIKRARTVPKSSVSVSLEKINGVLGTQLGEADVEDALKRLGLAHAQEGSTFTVTPPFERLDLIIPEDLVEEVGRIIGYDKIPAVELPALAQKPEVNPNFYAAEKIREELMAQGYSEVFTSVFADTGERVVANKVDGVRPYLRSTLLSGLQDSLKRNVRNKELLGVKEVKLFEIGTIWHDGGETMMVGTVGEKEQASEKPLQGIAVTAYDDLPISSTERYKTFSRYPFIVRDIALWISRDTDALSVLDVIHGAAGKLLVTFPAVFDRFEKGEKVSLAVRLIFQSFEKTLTDAEANVAMEQVYAAVKAKGWEVR
jgi:phenylalanyl-tRNA synthetase beta chain